MGIKYILDLLKQQLQEMSGSLQRPKVAQPALEAREMQREGGDRVSLPGTLIFGVCMW